MTEPTTQALIELADKYAFFMPGSAEGAKVREQLLDALEAQDREIERLQVERDVNKRMRDQHLKIEDPVTVPRGLLGAACRAIAHKDDAPNTLEQLRQYTVGNLSPSMTGKAARSPDKAWALFCSEIGEVKSPYPGMIGAFEAHYGQSFKDKDWRNEASVWAQAWSAATRATTPPATQPAPKGLFIDLIAAQGPEFVAEMAAIKIEPAPSLQGMKIVTDKTMPADELRIVQNGNTVGTITNIATPSTAGEREAFEAHIAKDCGDLSMFGVGKNMHYCNSSVNHEWEGWKARAALLQPTALPERDPSKPAEAQGLFHKFNVTRTDGSDQPGGKHHGCAYFVLDVDHDPHAKPALQAYAVACAQSHPHLSEALIALHGTALPDHPEQHLDMVATPKIGCVQHDCAECQARAALPVGELTLPSKRDIGEFDPKKSGSTFFRGLGWNEAIDEVAGLLAAARAQPVLEPLTPEESVAHAIGLTGGRQ